MEITGIKWIRSVSPTCRCVGSVKSARRQSRGSCVQAEPAGNRTKAACKDESGAVRQHTRRYKSKKKTFCQKFDRKSVEQNRVTDSRIRHY